MFQQHVLCVRTGVLLLGAARALTCRHLPPFVMTEIPYAADAEISLTYDELEVLKLQYVKEQAQGHITVQTKFNYAWGLVKSPQREHQEQGVKLLQGWRRL